MTFEDLEALSKMNFSQINTKDLMDIKDIKINQELSVDKKIIQYLNDSKNPYFLKYGDTIIKISFADENIRINDCMKQYLIDCLDERL